MKTNLLFKSVIILAFSILLSPAVTSQYKPMSPLWGQDVQLFDDHDLMPPRCSNIALSPAINAL